MYDLLDRPVADLPTEDCTRLRAIRAGVHALTLAGHAAPAASEDAFDAALRVLDAQSTGTLEFQRPCHVTVEETEAVVLGLWRLVAADRLPAALGVARSLVGDAAGTFVAAVQRTV